jgi:hypothetical protein
MRGYGFVIPDGLEVACFVRGLIAVQREQGAEIMADAETQIVNLVAAPARPAGATPLGG